MQENHGLVTLKNWNRSGFGDRAISEDGVETICMLPLVRCKKDPWVFFVW